MKHADELNPPCEGRPDIFESPFYADHRVARDLCKTCPLELFTACQRLVEAPEQNFQDGTWAGVLYVDGKPNPNGKRPRVAAEAESGVADLASAFQDMFRAAERG